MNKNLDYLKFELDIMRKVGVEAYAAAKLDLMRKFDELHPDTVRTVFNSRPHRFLWFRLPPKRTIQQVFFPGARRTIILPGGKLFAPRMMYLPRTRPHWLVGQRHDW